MSAIWKFLSFLFIFTSSVTSGAHLPRKFKADVHTLQMVQLVSFMDIQLTLEIVFQEYYSLSTVVSFQIFRAGDRSPLTQYPNDGHKNITFWYRYADGFGALTKVWAASDAYTYAE